MISVLQGYIPRFIVGLQRKNDDLIFVSASYLSREGDIYQLDKRTVSSTSLIFTTQSFNELSFETSDVYPFAIVPPKDFDGTTIIQSPSLETVPTASQNYYAPIYFERYTEDVMRSIDKSFSDVVTLTPTNITLGLTKESGFPTSSVISAKLFDPFENEITTNKPTEVWTSEDVTVVTVSSVGKVTAVNLGSTTITVTLGNASASTTINVTGAEITEI